MLNIKNLNVDINKKIILENVNLNIKKGEIHLIMGPNGSGKSTLSKTLLNDKSYNIKAEKLTFSNENLLNKMTDEIANMGIFLLTQNPLEIEGVTNAMMLRAASKDKTLSALEFNKKLIALCEKLDIPTSFIHREINLGMSGGEKKKNELLHMWVLEPNFIILDEIDSGLDVDSFRTVLNSIKEYYETNKPAILIISHDEEVAEYLKPDYVHIMNNNTIVETGDSNLIEKIMKEGY